MYVNEVFITHLPFVLEVRSFKGKDSLTFIQNIQHCVTIRNKVLFLSYQLKYKILSEIHWRFSTFLIFIFVLFIHSFQSRVLATIGVTRGFGDHELKAPNSNIDIKPFLLSQPEVSNINICNQ